MNTIKIDLIHSRALRLLQELEALHIIKLHKPNEDAKVKLSEKYRGILSKEEGKNLNEHIDQMRKEWNNSL